MGAGRGYQSASSSLGMVIHSYDSGCGGLRITEGFTGIHANRTTVMPSLDLRIANTIAVMEEAITYLVVAYRKVWFINPVLFCKPTDTLSKGSN